MPVDHRLGLSPSARAVVLKDVVSAVRVVFDELKVAHRAEETSRTRAYMGEQALDAYKHLHGQVPAFEKYLNLLLRVRWAEETIICYNRLPVQGRRGASNRIRGDPGAFGCCSK